MQNKPYYIVSKTYFYIICMNHSIFLNKRMNTIATFKYKFPTTYIAFPSKNNKQWNTFKVYYCKVFPT